MPFKRRILYAALTSVLTLLCHVSAPAQAVDRSKTLNEVASLRKELDEKQKLLLTPRAEDLARFAEFLKQPETGLICLLPRSLYDDTLTIRGGGAYYSFVRLAHDYGLGSDIAFEKIERTSEFTPPPIATYIFDTGFAGASYGFIVTLGAVPLEKVTLDHGEVKSLAAYNPPSTLPEARAEQQRSRQRTPGAEWDSYKAGALATVNYTYALRSIDFEKSDVLVAFRVVRKEIDGGVVILWKMLKRFPTPHLQR
ncbi:MAG TPA: hypothetical protein VFS27_00445 [Blastocatellia bacterium]|jgi:hypothetical protein|nr:hypothetical protein [Blastocatellia bacterium]